MKRFLTILFALLSMSLVWANDYNNIREDQRYVYLVCSDGLLNAEDNKKVTICSRDAVSEDCYWVIDANNRVYSAKFGKELGIAKNHRLKKKGNAIFQNGYIVCANPAKGEYIKLSESKFVAKSIYFGANILSTENSQPKYLTAIKSQKQKLENSAKSQYYSYRQDFISNILKGYNASSKSQTKVDTSKLWGKRWATNDVLNTAKYNNENYVTKGSAYNTWNGGGTLMENLFHYSDGYYHYKNNYKGFSAKDYLFFPNETYSHPWQSCLSAPTAKWHYKISRDYWVIEVVEQVQVDPAVTISEYGVYQDKHVPEKPVEVRDLDEEAYDKNGWRAEFKAFKQGTYDTKITLWGWKIPVNITCSRKMWPTPRRSRGTYGGGRYNSAAIGHDADPYCPWRVHQNLTIRIDLNKLSKQLGMSKLDIQACFLRQAIRHAGKGRQDKYAISAILYRLYGKSMINTLNKNYKKALEKKDYVAALECAYHLGLEDKVESSCSQSFNECKDVKELIDTFKKVADILYPDIEELGVGDLVDVIFDGVNKDKNTPYSTPSKLYGTDNVRRKYFNDFVNQRNKFLDENNPFKCFTSSSSPIDNKKFLDPTFHEAFYSYKPTDNSKKLFADYANACVEEMFVNLLNSPAKSLKFIEELDTLYSKGYLGSTHPSVRFANKYGEFITKALNECLCNNIEQFADAIRNSNKSNADAGYVALNKTLKTIRFAEEMLQIKIINKMVQELCEEYINCYKMM